MDKKYVELFSLIAQTTANIAEQVMDFHKDNREEKEYLTAQTMRDDYQNLHDKIESDAELAKADYARLLVGAIIVANQIDARVKAEQKALRGYKIDIIPKLDQLNQANEADIAALAEKLFEIKEEVTEESESDN